MTVRLSTARPYIPPPPDGVVIYVDPLTDYGHRHHVYRKGYCHLFSNNIDYLLEFAKSIGLKPEWMQRASSGMIFFDIVHTKRYEAVRRGAVELKFNKQWEKVVWKCWKICNAYKGKEAIGRGFG
jgi:hypothetical protein